MTARVTSWRFANRQDSHLFCQPIHVRRHNRERSRLSNSKDLCLAPTTSICRSWWSCIGEGVPLGGRQFSLLWGIGARVGPPLYALGTFRDPSLLSRYNLRLKMPLLDSFYRTPFHLYLESR